MSTKPKLAVILGPTASGKTDYGIELAKKTNGAVISADSRQVYAGMNVGTAKPEGVWSDSLHEILVPDEVPPPAPPSKGGGSSAVPLLTKEGLGEVSDLAGFTDLAIEHYLFNIRTPDNPLTLSEWQEAAFKVIDYVIGQRKHPILVGGTMLYIDSIVDNYDIPNVQPDRAFRAELEKKVERKKPRSRDSIALRALRPQHRITLLGKKTEKSPLYEELIKKDPKARQFIEPHNTRRIIRALEVIDATGKPFSAQRRSRPPRYDCELIGLFTDWNNLRSRITKRAKKMLQEGLLEETKKLQKTYGKDLPLLQTMNYKQAAAVLAGEMTKQEAIDEMVRVNMRYAHRQISWWNSRSDIQWMQQ